MVEAPRYGAIRRLSPLRFIWWTAAVLLCLATPAEIAASASLHRGANPSARADLLLHEALDAQGGETRLRDLKALRWEAEGYHYALDQSADTTGIAPTTFDEVEQVHDLAGHRYRSRNAVLQPGSTSASVTLLAGNEVAHVGGDGRQTPGTEAQRQLIEEFWALNPERLLLSAIDAGDARTGTDAPIGGVQQHVIVFTLDGAPVRLYLDPASRLPTAWDYTGPLAQSGAAAQLGEAVLRMRYSGWSLTSAGIRFPLQWNVEVNGQPDHMLRLRNLQFNPQLDESELTLSPEAREAFERQSRTSGTAPAAAGADPMLREIAPDVLWAAASPGTPGVLVVRQADGIVILDPPHSPEFSSAVIAEARKRSPALPIKAIVSTSGRWSAFGGLSEYLADGTPVYALSANRPLLARLRAMPHPHALTSHRDEPQLHWLTGADSIALGSGKNRLQLYGFQGISTADCILVYLPAQHLVYASTARAPVSPDEDSQDLERVSEIRDAITRESLQVDRLIFGDGVVRTWQDVSLALAVRSMPTDTATRPGH